MRTPVKCKNCGLKWLRVTILGSPLEMLEDLQYNCPRCGSNYFDEIPPEQLKEV